MRIGVLILGLATLAFLIWLGMSGGAHRTSVELDNRREAYDDARRTVARIQSDLERTAAGRRPWPLPTGISGDPLEAVVDAYRLFLDGNSKGMDARLKDIVATVGERLPPAQQGDAGPRAETATYFARLGEAVVNPAPAVRMVAALRLVDGLLFLEAAGWSQADPVARTSRPTPALDGTWLRLPCRTVIGRQTALRDAQAALGDLAGPLLSCPSDNADLAVLEAQANAPAMLPTRTQAITLRAALIPRTEPSAPPTPWDHETAVAWMDEDPDAAEPVLAAAVDAASRLDYALFLSAFRPGSPDTQARIDALLRSIDPDRTGFDGSDESLAAALRQAVASGAAPAYAIPCAVLQARPGLLAVTATQAETEAPLSGCSTGRGQVRGFPDAELAAFVAAAEDADGHFMAHRGGAPSPTQQAALETLKLAPRQLAAQEPPAMDHPYQVWGMTSLGNRATVQRIAAPYREAAAKLAAWYVRQGLAADEAERAARTGLFRVVWGANCGGAAPAPSLRGLILDRAPIAQIREAPTDKEAPEVTRCAVHAGLDPLVHVAVGYPPALDLLLDRGAKADERNAFGKTPLMAAAQADQGESVRLLLDHGAAVNATTWQRNAPPLAHDGRTALMYAAASGSLPVIKLLLGRGADPHMADTKGSRAIDYLLGFGPLPANTVLNPTERSEAARLLY